LDQQSGMISEYRQTPQVYTIPQIDGRGGIGEMIYKTNTP
jgi:hypothetical protein